MLFTLAFCPYSERAQFSLANISRSKLLAFRWNLTNRKYGSRIFKAGNGFNTFLVRCATKMLLVGTIGHTFVVSSCRPQRVVGHVPFIMKPTIARKKSSIRTLPRALCFRMQAV